MLHIQYESKGTSGRLARLTVRADIEELSIVDQRIFMTCLGRAMIDEIRARWEHGASVEGTPAAKDPPVQLRVIERAILIRHIEKKIKREVRRLQRGEQKMLRAKPALKAAKALAAKTKKKKEKPSLKAQAEEDAGRVKTASEIVANYKLRKPVFSSTAIHGSKAPQIRVYVPEPKNPAHYGSGLMANSLYAVFKPYREYTNKQGQKVVVQSGVQFVVQRNRFLAAYRAGLTPYGLQVMLTQLRNAELELLLAHYMALEKNTFVKTLYAAARAVARVASSGIGLVSGTAGFLLW